MRVLIVEDELPLAEATARVLRREGMAVDVATDGDLGFRQATTRTYDVIVLDRNLPGLHGDELCRRLVRRKVEALILMVTAAGELESRVAGLELGADDYLPKPVALPELIARVRALARRRGDGREHVLSWRDLVLDREKRRVTRGDGAIELTHKEFAVLEELFLADGGTVPAKRLGERGWENAIDLPSPNTLRATVMRLRRKLGDPPIVETVVGVGYRLR